jgi:hypothetical protein
MKTTLKIILAVLAVSALISVAVAQGQSRQSNGIFKNHDSNGGGGQGGI